MTTLLATFKNHHTALLEGKITPQELLAAFEWVIANKEGLKAEIAKMTIADIKAKVHSYHAKTKKEWIAAFYGSVVGTFVLKGYSYGMARADEYETVIESAQRAVVVGTTAEDIAKYVAEKAAALAEHRQRHEEMKQGLQNPTTLQHFSWVKEYREGGWASLTADERERLDTLCWAKRRSDLKTEQESKSRIACVDLGEVEAVLHQTAHTQKGYALFVVVLSDWIERNDFEDLCEIAHRFGGYYSSYSANGAIPGFTFTSEPMAKEFITVFENDVSDLAIRDERRRLAALNAKDRLMALAEAMVSDADADLSRDRKVNTVRRANQMESVIARNFAWKALAKTMMAVSTVLGGEDHPLDGIRHRSHLQLLNEILNRAIWRNTNKGATPNEVIATATLPKLMLDREEIPACVRRLSAMKNTIRLCEFLSKAHRAGVERVEFNDATEREFAVKLFQKLGDATPWYLAEALRDRRRLDRMGIRTGNDLRHALRALNQLTVQVEQEDPKAKRIRDLIGREIPGFFPTPEPLARELLRLADIQAGNIVIEPSAGKGDLADLIAEEHPDCRLTCIEQCHSLVEILAADHTVIHGDWLEQNLLADRIVMNPPFENAQDIDHVRYAYDRLLPGGKLVSIISAGSLSRSDNKARQFKEWLDGLKADVHCNPEGAFLSSFRPTGVNTATVVITKAA